MFWKVVSIILFSVLLFSMIKTSDAQEVSEFPLMDKNNDRLHDVMEVLPGPFDIIIRLDHSPSETDELTFIELLGPEIETFDNFNWIAALQVSKDKVFRITDIPGVNFVELVGPPLIPEIRGALDVAARTIQARASNQFSPNTAEDNGLTGQGINICIIDTGVDDLMHESLQGKFVGGLNAITNTVGNPDDDHGHGTHVAGIAMGTGGPSQQYKGIAPAAGLVDVKVLTANNLGTAADIIQGIDFCITNQNNLNIRVINLSIETPGFYPPGNDAMSIAANRAVNSGLVTVACSGNEGPNPNTITSPGAADKVITVGNIDDHNTISRTDDTINWSSSRGLRTSDADGERRDELKPEITAPGSNIISAQFNTISGYVSMGGCSMATPVVAGAIALMLEQNPSLTTTQVEIELLSTSEEKDGVYDPALNTLYDRDYGEGELIAIPEFGSIATIILVAAIVGTIVVTKRNKLR